MASSGTTSFNITIDEVIEENGSWETRKNYERWNLMEVL